MLGVGRRLFADRTELDLTHVLDALGVTHMHYPVAPLIGDEDGSMG